MTFGFIYLLQEGALEIVLWGTDATPEGALDDVGVQQRVVVVVLNGIVEGSVGGLELLMRACFHRNFCNISVTEMADYAECAEILPALGVFVVVAGVFPAGGFLPEYAVVAALLAFPAFFLVMLVGLVGDMAGEEAYHQLGEEAGLFWFGLGDVVLIGFVFPDRGEV